MFSEVNKNSSVLYQNRAYVGGSKSSETNHIPENVFILSE